MKMEPLPKKEKKEKKEKKDFLSQSSKYNISWKK